jgi:hypothetical protein
MAPTMVLVDTTNKKTFPILQLALSLSFLAVIQIGTCGNNDTRGTSRSFTPTFFCIAVLTSGMLLKLPINMIINYNWQLT